MMEMIRQLRGESAIGMVANVAIAADTAKARAEEAVREVAELRGKFKELLEYETQNHKHLTCRIDGLLFRNGASAPPAKLPTL
jgi:hypothetical protein